MRAWPNLAHQPGTQLLVTNIQPKYDMQQKNYHRNKLSEYIKCKKYGKLRTLYMVNYARRHVPAQTNVIPRLSEMASISSIILSAVGLI